MQWIDHIPIFSTFLPCCGTKITHKSNSTEVARKHSRPARRCFIEYRWNSRSRTSFGKDTSDEIAVVGLFSLPFPLPSPSLSPLTLTSAQPFPFPFAFGFSVDAFILCCLFHFLCLRFLLSVCECLCVVFDGWWVFTSSLAYFSCVFTLLRFLDSFIHTFSLQLATLLRIAVRSRYVQSIHTPDTSHCSLERIYIYWDRMTKTWYCW